MQPADHHVSHGAAAYSAARDRLLADFVAQTEPDERFVAAWLTGSHGRGQADAASDLDLTLVVADSQRDVLCARPWMAAEGTTSQRLAVLRQFGEPVVIHENHHNAPPGGSFTFVLYAGSAQMLDLVFVPFSDARRPPHSRLLFEKASIALLEPPPPQGMTQRMAAASERVSFFWMVAAAAGRHMLRGQTVTFYALLDMLHQVAAEIERLCAGELYGARGRPHAAAPQGTEPQAQAVRLVCVQVLDMMPTVERMGGSVPPSPMAEIETLLRLAQTA
jgi:hypothetical protein